MDIKVMDSNKINEAIRKMSKLAESDGLTMLESYQVFKSLYYGTAQMLGIEENKEINKTKQTILSENNPS